MYVLYHLFPSHLGCKQDTDKEVNRSNIPKHDPKHLEYSGPFKLFYSDVKHFKYKCTSLKACENLTQRLRLTHHTEVTVELWRDIRMIQGDVDLVETNQSRRNAYRCAIDSLRFLVRNPHNMISCSIEPEIGPFRERP
jgi:hypothetical protein